MFNLSLYVYTIQNKQKKDILAIFIPYKSNNKYKKVIQLI